MSVIDSLINIQIVAQLVIKSIRLVILAPL